MKTSTDRMLTTHTGALYRPRDLEEMLAARQNGGEHDAAQIETRPRTAVAEVVEEQARHGVDIVSEHATFVLDHPEAVAQRIERFALVVGRERVIAGTDCGHRGRVPRSLQWPKQQAVTDGAALATGRLWR